MGSQWETDQLDVQNENKEDLALTLRGIPAMASVLEKEGRVRWLMVGGRGAGGKRSGQVAQGVGFGGRVRWLTNRPSTPWTNTSENITFPGTTNLIGNNQKSATE